MAKKLLSSRIPRLLVLLLLAGSTFGCRELAEKEADDKMAKAETALRAEDWKQADDLFYEAVLYDPERVEAWIGRGMALTKLGDEDGARTHYQQALTLFEQRTAKDPFAPEPLRGRIMLLVLLNRSGEAMAVASEAARAHPNKRFAGELAALVDHIEQEFGDMILPPDDGTIPFPAISSTATQQETER